MTRPSTVCIVGAGPSGLVAAKTLLHSYPNRFAVTMLEKHSTVGGLWPTEPDQQDTLLNPEMRTNLSRHTVSFSDFSWASVDLGLGSGKLLNGECENDTTAEAGDKIPMFPKAWQVGRYLQSYAQAYLQKATVLLNSRVTSAVRQECDKRTQWRVKWSKQTPRLDKGSNLPCSADPPASGPSESEEALFDYLVVASGFFGTPKIPPLPGSDLFPGAILHSTEFRTLEDVMRTEVGVKNTNKSAVKNERIIDDGEAKKIVIVGGGMSGVETASAVALQVSTAQYSPRQNTPERRGYQIYHVTSRPFYALPTYLPIDPLDPIQSRSELEKTDTFNSAPSFAPLDLCLYSMTRRRPGPISAYTGVMTEQQSQPTHTYLSTLGGNLSDLGSEAVRIGDEERKLPARIGISDTYSEFVRSGAILPVQGSLESLGDDGNGAGAVTYKNRSLTQKTLDGVVGVIMATGFTPQHSLDWLPQDVLDTLRHDPNHDRLPIILQHGSYHHADSPNLGFVGFYQGPFWGVMEMQARLLGQLWAMASGKAAAENPKDEEEERQHMLSLRRGLKESPERYSPFWMGDYVGFMETLARSAGIPRIELDGYEERGGPLVPARYLYKGSDVAESAKTLADLDRTLQRAATRAAFVPRAAFRAMQGRWLIRRTLKSAIASYPSGTFVGTADFHPRRPTDARYDAEYLYIEDGDFVTDAGLTMRGSRRYVYRYEAPSDVISAWFVKPDDGRSVDYFFHSLQFVLPDGAQTAPRDGWRATGHHLCAPDDYDAEYVFRFRGAAVERFAITYRVKGPKKDYVSETWFERPKTEGVR